MKYEWTSAAFLALWVISSSTGCADNNMGYSSRKDRSLRVHNNENPRNRTSRRTNRRTKNTNDRSLLAVNEWATKNCETLKSVSWSSDTPRVAIICDKSLAIWRYSPFVLERARTIAGLSRRASAAISGNFKTVAFTDASSVEIRAIGTGKSQSIPSSMTGTVLGIALNSNGRRLVHVDEFADKTYRLRIWDTIIRRHVVDVPIPKAFLHYNSKTDSIHSVFFDDSIGRVFILSLQSDLRNHVLCFNSATGVLVWRRAIPRGLSTWANDGFVANIEAREIAIINHRGTTLSFFEYSASSGSLDKQFIKLPNHRNPAIGVAADTKRLYYALGYQGGEIYLFNRLTGRAIRHYTTFNGKNLFTAESEVTLSFDFLSRFLACAGCDPGVRILRIR